MGTARTSAEAPAPWRRPWAAALLLAALVVGAHLWIRAHAPAPRFWGDEGHYALLAQEEAEAGRTSLLPGTLGFDHRPVFGVRVYALFVPGLFAGTTLLNAFLLGATVLLTFGQGRLLGLGVPGALGAAALLGFFPWYGFHVHSLWPEILHGFFAALLWSALFLHLRDGRGVWLVVAGAATAQALLTKGSLGPFVGLFAVFAGAVAWRAGAGLPGARRALCALRPSATYALATLALLAPQLLHNARAGHGYNLAANRWWNLELGLATESSVDEVNRRYWASSTDFVERERAARARTLAHLRTLSPGELCASQARKLWALIARKPSEFEASLHREARWGAEPPAWLAALERPARMEWYLLLVLGAIGAAWHGWRSRPWLLLSLFALAFLFALALVPVKPRFALPLVPALCLFSGATLEGVWAHLRAWRARKTKP